MKKHLTLIAALVAALAVAGCLAWSLLYSGGSQTSAAQGEAQITLAETGIQVSGTGAKVSGTTVSITSGGTYTVTGKLSNGQIYIDAGDEDTVVLVLNGVELANDDDAAIYVENAGQTQILLQDGTTNTISSGQETALENADAESDEDASGAAIYARDDLLITGEGTLIVYGYINNGIHTTNDLTIESGTYEVTALNNAIKGKDSVTITGGTFTLAAGNDGIKADDTTGDGYGVIAISGGTFNITAGGDGVQAETTLTISGGSFTVNAGDVANSEVTPEADTSEEFDRNWDREGTDAASTKGFKCGTELVITGGTFTVNAEDDAFHSNGDITISSGIFVIYSGDDGVHADLALNIEDGEIEILQCYEGLEGNQIEISGGNISITASDDGINAYGGQNWLGWGSQSDADTPDETPNLHITGGTIYIDAGGDGLDSNGNLIIDGGDVVVDGPSHSWNGALDSGSESGGVCAVNGGTVIAIGSSGMAETFGASSEQASFCYNFDTAQAAGSTITITDASGNVLYEHEAAKEFSSVVFSCPQLEQGETYQLTVGETTAEITLDSVSTSVSTGVVLGQGQAPSQGQDPGQMQAPGQGQAPGQMHGPDQGQAPEQEQIPDQGQAPGQGQGPEQES